MLPMDPMWMYKLMTEAYWDQLKTQSTQSQLKGLPVPTNVRFGAPHDNNTGKWEWRSRKMELTRFGKKSNLAALAKELKQRERREKRKAALPWPSIAGTYETSSKKRRIDSMLDVNAGKETM
jgi:hypothetical protein